MKSKITLSKAYNLIEKLISKLEIEDISFSKRKKAIDSLVSLRFDLAFVSIPIQENYLQLIETISNLRSLNKMELKKELAIKKRDKKIEELKLKIKALKASIDSFNKENFIKVSK